MLHPRVSISFGTGINLKHAEDTVARLGEEASPNSEVHLDFSQCRHIDIGAGWRIGNALRRYGHSSLLHVTVPPLSSAQPFSQRWFLSFTRSGLGFALAAYAATIRTIEGDVTQLVREYYQSRVREEWTNLVVVTDLSRGINIDVNNFDGFLRRFYQWLPYVNINRQMSPKQEKDLVSLAKLCFEAIQNVYDHANRSPLSMDTRILSYFSMRYYHEIGNPRELAGDFVGYLERSKLKWGNQEPTGFIEIIVNDDGVGISARQSQLEEIYWSPISKEDEALQLATEKGTSIKLKVKDTIIRGDPGYGFIYITNCLYRLNAYAVLRSGRRQTVFDSTVTKQETFCLLPDVLGYMPGTALHIVIPIPTVQLKLL